MPEQFKIKRCPFCSYTELSIQITEKKVCVKCVLCKSQGPEFEFENLFADNFSHEDAEEFAFDRWNYRPEEYEEEEIDSGDNVEKGINQAIKIYMKNTLQVDKPTNIRKFLIACDLLSFLNKEPPEE